MSDENRARDISRCALLLAVIITSVVSADGDVCVYKPPTVWWISGVLVDQQHVSIAGATLTVLERGTALESIRMNNAGAFDFDIEKPGKYEVDVSAAFSTPDINYDLRDRPRSGNTRSESRWKQVAFTARVTPFV